MNETNLALRACKPHGEALSFVKKTQAVKHNRNKEIEHANRYGFACYVYTPLRFGKRSRRSSKHNFDYSFFIKIFIEKLYMYILMKMVFKTNLLI
jgi:hypothetical protein